MIQQFHFILIYFSVNPCEIHFVFFKFDNACKQHITVNCPSIIWERGKWILSIKQCLHHVTDQLKWSNIWKYVLFNDITLNTQLSSHIRVSIKSGNNFMTGSHDIIQFIIVITWCNFWQHSLALYKIRNQCDLPWCNSDQSILLDYYCLLHIGIRLPDSVKTNKHLF